MDPIVIVLLWLTVVALVALGIAGAVLPALPGVPMVFAGLWLGAWIDGYARIGTGTLIVLGVLTALSLLIDFVASALGAKRVGASPKAVTGAVLGSLVGLFFGLPGIILGPLVDSSFRRGLIAEGGDIGQFALSFVVNPISLVLTIGFLALLLQYAPRPSWLRWRRG